MRVVMTSRTDGITIGELSKLTGVHIETIRYFERVKMLPNRRALLPVVAPMARHMFACWHSSSAHGIWAFRPTTFEVCSASEDPAKHPATGFATSRRITSTISGRGSPNYVSWNGCWQKRLPNVLAPPHPSARFWTSSIFNKEAASEVLMSALGQKQTFAPQKATSALPQ